MNRIAALCICVVVPLVTAQIASAQQLLPPGASQFNPPPPAPPPPPSMAVPVVPRMDEPVAQPEVRPSSRGSFSDRISTCLDEGAASGLGAGERAAWSRSCANQ